MTNGHQGQETQAPYNTNPELTRMREDIANRNYNITMKTMVITGITLVAGAALGALAIPALVGGTGMMVAMNMFVGAMMGGIVGAMGGGMFAGMMTLKDRKQLQIDEEMVNSYMGGKNYWGAGYRQEVAEHGYGGPQIHTHRNNLASRGGASPGRS